MHKIKVSTIAISLLLSASLLSACSSLMPDKGNANTTNTANSNKGTEQTSANSATPSPSPSGTPAVAQNVNERIRFGKGKEGTTLKGEVTANGSSTYTLGAKEGQSIDITVSSGKKGVSFDLVDKKTGETLAENVTNYSDLLPSNGDYTIRVYSTKGGDTYTLKVSIVSVEGDE